MAIKEALSSKENGFMAPSYTIRFDMPMGKYAEWTELPGKAGDYTYRLFNAIDESLGFHVSRSSPETRLEWFHLCHWELAC